MLSLNTITIILLLIILIIIINLIIFNFKLIFSNFKNIKKITWLILLIIFLSGFYIRFFYIPHINNLYYDEDGYLDSAKNIAKLGENCLCLYNDESCNLCGISYKNIGFNLLLSIPIKFFGQSQNLGFNFVALFGSLTIITIFLFVYLLFKKEDIALYSSLILALYPLHIKLSGSINSEILSLFFIILTFIFLLLYIDTKSNTILSLSILLLVFTITLRDENIILPLFFILPLFKSINKKKVITLIILILIILIPYILGSYLFHSDYNSRYTFGKEGNILSLNFFKNFFLINLLSLINPILSLSLVLILSFVGMLFMFKSNYKLTLFLLFWIISIISIYSAFSEAPLIVGSNMRYYIQAIIPIIIFASFSTHKLNIIEKFKKYKLDYLISFLIIISIIPYNSYLISNISLNPIAQQDKNFLLSNLENIPEDCIIVTPEAYVLDFYSRKAISSLVMDRFDLNDKCLYFYKSEICYTELIDHCSNVTGNLKEVYTNNRHSFYKLQ